VSALKENWGTLGSPGTQAGDRGCGHESGLEKLARSIADRPDEAARFVVETGVDALAVAMGTSHGAGKFTRNRLEVSRWTTR
jgi:fructose-bisphosphate aldolase class II